MDGGISLSKIRRACLEDRNCGIKTIGFFFSSTISKSEYADSKLFLRRKIISRERKREGGTVHSSVSNRNTKRGTITGQANSISTFD